MRIVLADNDQRTFSALRILLECQPQMEVVGEALHVSRLLEVVRDRCPHLVLLDWELRGEPDHEFLTKLRELVPDVSLIALSGRPESEQAALRAGADAFVSKAEPAHVLMAKLMSFASDPA